MKGTLDESILIVTVWKCSKVENIFETVWLGTPSIFLLQQDGEWYLASVHRLDAALSSTYTSTHLCRFESASAAPLNSRHLYSYVCTAYILYSAQNTAQRSRFPFDWDILSCTREDSQVIIVMSEGSSSRSLVVVMSS